MVFDNENKFEHAVIVALQQHGWSAEVLHHYTSQKLLRNWADILFKNNNLLDRLNDAPLTDTEMEQIVEQIRQLRTPLKLNDFVNGKTVAITRDNPDDPLHLGKEISLEIYDRNEIAAGHSCYQIVEQPEFGVSSHMFGEHRGDLMLLINGMPLIHIELKRSGIPVSQACSQIERYSRDGVFDGIFSLVQVFVAMTPEETVYFANPGPDGSFDRQYYFHWADFNNEPVNDWHEVVSSLLSIPMAHQLIGFYTVADDTDGVLKVMRSYQYYAANSISDRVRERVDWKGNDQRGGYVWHTTGSGKTMTSFKSAQLIASSNDADKVVFLMDRIELGTQSLMEYKGFADAKQDVQATENSNVLVGKLVSDKSSDALIVTSIQKMGIISGESAMRAADFEHIQSKRIVFIIDEAHRSTFGENLRRIRDAFPHAMFFGFTGTPIQKENKKKRTTTTMIFGDELHRYSIADGIRDKNVLGFDPHRVDVLPPNQLRECIALGQAKANNVGEAVSDPDKEEIYYRYLDEQQVPMTDIENMLPLGQYSTSEYQKAVVNDIGRNWQTLSRDSKFHALFATSSIPEAVQYYHLFKRDFPRLKVTALFDPNAPEGESRIAKEADVAEILTDYNQRYGHDFVLATHANFKKDVAARLSHKKPYERIGTQPDEQLDLLIVVDQMLTGFDSKWLNTLYLDKLLKYEGIIQAFSRTNRLAGSDKPFGTIRYYRKPATMERNIEDAVELYSGNRPLGLFVDHLDQNLEAMNDAYRNLTALFENAGVENLSKLPDDSAEQGEFAQLFSRLHGRIESAKIQGFSWGTKEYSFTNPERTVIAEITEAEYLTLAQRYRELAEKAVQAAEDSVSVESSVPYDIDPNLAEIDTGRIDADYMNSRFEKYLKILSDGGDEQLKQKTLEDLHRSFARLTQEEQRYAGLFLRDVESGDADLVDGKTFRDYIVEYQSNSKQHDIDRLSRAFGVDAVMLRMLASAGVNDSNINEYGRFDKLKDGVDPQRSWDYLKTYGGVGGVEIPSSLFKVSLSIDTILKDFICNDKLDLKPENEDTAQHWRDWN
jgi:type I restriction enzyme R subunit